MEKTIWAYIYISVYIRIYMCVYIYIYIKKHVYYRRALYSRKNEPPGQYRNSRFIIPTRRYRQLIPLQSRTYVQAMIQKLMLSQDQALRVSIHTSWVPNKYFHFRK